MHLAHLQTVPFENFDITLGRRINLDMPVILDKIVNQNRGGFCYELNSAFAWLLREIGFEVVLLSARTYDGSSLSPEFDHMLLRIDSDAPVIADVGFGDSFLLPLVAHGPDRFQFDRYYRLLNNDNRWVLQQRFETGDWKSQYIFEMQPHPLQRFEAMCKYHQISQSSTFTRKTVCSRATPQGRVTYANRRHIENEMGVREEVAIENETSLDHFLTSRFGMTLNSDDLKLLVSTSAGRRPDSR